MMDGILLRGNAVYESFISRSNTRMMLVMELPKSYDLGSIRYDFETVEEYYEILGQQESHAVGQWLYTSLQAALRKTGNCFLICGGYTILVLKTSDHQYATFDSHPQSENGPAVLMYFSNLQRQICLGEVRGPMIIFR
jgi:hypothetical protein